jgi:hypothetical protein
MSSQDFERRSLRDYTPYGSATVATHMSASSLVHAEPARKFSELQYHRVPSAWVSLTPSITTEFVQTRSMFRTAQPEVREN